MTVFVPHDAPAWAHAMVQAIQDDYDAKLTTLFGGKAFATSDLPDATKHAYKIILLSDGASNKNIAISDGTDWRYADGNTV